jgi:hypothetical protein
MSNSSINYLFPPDQIHNLPTWRFVLHFMVTPQFNHAMLQRAVQQLKAAEWSIVVFPYGLEGLALDQKGRTVSVPIEVPDDRRRRPNSLAQYESDVWNIIGNMVGRGFGDIYYEAVDWREDADGKSESVEQSNERAFHSLQHETTKRWAILEDNGTSAWLYITDPDSTKPVADCFAYSCQPPEAQLPATWDRESPPPITTEFASNAACRADVAQDRIQLLWAASGNAAAVLLDSVPIAFIVVGEKQGHSRAIAVDGPYGRPWNAARFAEAFQ